MAPEFPSSLGWETCETLFFIFYDQVNLRSISNFPAASSPKKWTPQKSLKSRVSATLACPAPNAAGELIKGVNHYLQECFLDALADPSLVISKRLCQHMLSCYCLLSQVIPGWWILTVCPLLVADSMQNSVCFADEGPKGTSKEILPLWFLLLGESKASLPWENQTLPKGRGSADHLHQKPHLSTNALLPEWPTL